MRDILEARDFMGSLTVAPLGATRLFRSAETGAKRQADVVRLLLSLPIFAPR